MVRAGRQSIVSRALASWRPPVGTGSGTSVEQLGLLWIRWPRERRSGEGYRILRVRPSKVVEQQNGELGIVVLTPNGQSVVYPEGDFWRADEDLGLADATALTHLNVPNLFGSLRAKFSSSHQDWDLSLSYTEQSGGSDSGFGLYTALGTILLCMNPFEHRAFRGESLYSSRMVRLYREGELLAPHPFLWAKLIRERLMRDQADQSIVISGTSGSGKTETSKHLVKYLCADSGDNGNGSLTMSALDEAVLAANPLLESFGNAATVRNLNSSRFGRNLRLTFGSEKCRTLNRCQVSTFLLAKSRVVRCPPLERNYHLFYAILKGLEPYLRESLGLKGDHKSFRITATPEALESMHIPFNLGEIRSAFREMGVTTKDQDEIIKVVAAVLFLGNLPLPTTPGEEWPSSRATEFGNWIEELLGRTSTDPKDSELCRVLGFRRIEFHDGEVVMKPLEPLQIERKRGLLITHLYEICFQVVLRLINARLTPPGRTPLAAGREATINILDIYGFEDLQPEGPNGFEQLCINYANELLQYVFQQAVVKAELDLYRVQRIERCEDLFSSMHNYCGRQEAILHVFNCKQGIWSAFLNASQIGRHLHATGGGANSDGQLCMKINSLAAEHPHAVFDNLRSRRETFTITHFPGEVNYEGTGMCERNSDVHLPPDLRTLLSDIFRDEGPIRSLFADHIQEDESAGRSNAEGFVAQLDTLRAQLEESSCWFVRCIRPNNEQIPGSIDDRCVMAQLVSTGTLDVLKVMKLGFPQRLPYKRIQKEFGHLVVAGGGVVSRMDPRQFGVALVQELEIGTTEIALGTDYVFLKQGAYEKLAVLQSLDDEKRQILIDRIRRRALKNIFRKIVFCIKFVNRVQYFKDERLLRAELRITAFLIAAVRQLRAVRIIERIRRRKEACFRLEFIASFVIYRFIPVRRIVVVLQIAEYRQNAWLALSCLQTLEAFSTWRRRCSVRQSDLEFDQLKSPGALPPIRIHPEVTVTPPHDIRHQGIRSTEAKRVSQCWSRPTSHSKPILTEERFLIFSVGPKRIEHCILCVSWPQCYCTDLGEVKNDFRSPRLSSISLRDRGWNQRSTIAQLPQPIVNVEKTVAQNYARFRPSFSDFGRPLGGRSSTMYHGRDGTPICGARQPNTPLRPGLINHNTPTRSRREPELMPQPLSQNPFTPLKTDTPIGREPQRYDARNHSEVPRAGRPTRISRVDSRSQSVSVTRGKENFNTYPSELEFSKQRRNHNWV